MPRARALEWLTKYGAVVRKYPQEPATAYMGSGLKRSCDDVGTGRVPQPLKRCFGRLELNVDLALFAYRLVRCLERTKRGSCDVAAGRFHIDVRLEPTLAAADHEPLGRFVTRSPRGERNIQQFWAARPRDLVVRRAISEASVQRRLSGVAAGGTPRCVWSASHDPECSQAKT